MDSKEFGEWIAFETIEPGETPLRADVRSAIIAKTVSDAHQVKGLRRPFKEFMPNFGRDGKPENRVYEMKMMMKQMTARHNKRLKKEERGK